MTNKLFPIATWLLSAMLGNAASLDASAAFNRLKTLVGEWQAATDMGKAHVSYELIAEGTVLVERLEMEKMATMLTMYHLDGDRLILTHYCSVGNQPRMQAQTFHPESGELEFQFLDITNLARPGGGHMHNAKFRLVDPRHFTSEWQFFETGQKKPAEKFQFTRIR